MKCVLAMRSPFARPTNRRHARLCPDQLLAKRYFIEKRLGRGAMGQVYLARDENLGTRQVAVKTVRQDILNSDDLRKAKRLRGLNVKRVSAASIRHPNIVDVTDFGETEDGVFYLVMEYVEGETLHRLLRREGTLPVKRAVHFLRQIADGVEAAHDAGVLHRDLKPANIFIMNSGQKRRRFYQSRRFRFGENCQSNRHRHQFKCHAFITRNYRNARIYVARTDAAGTRRGRSRRCLCARHDCLFNARRPNAVYGRFDAVGNAENYAQTAAAVRPAFRYSEEMSKR